MLLQISDLKKVFRKKGQVEIKAVDGLNLEVARGEIVTVNGPSGSGKTTLLLAAGGLLFPDEGKVILEGTDFYESSPEERARIRASKTGFVFQQFHLIPYLNVIENAMVPATGLDPGSEKRAKELIRRFNLEERVKHMPSELSTGEKQRAALVRALVNNPVMLFADEPTGNLDDDNAREVMSYISDFAKNAGGVLLVSHDKRTALHSSKTFLMKNGKISPAK